LAVRRWPEGKVNHGGTERTEEYKEEKVKSQVVLKLRVLCVSVVKKIVRRMLRFTKERRTPYI